MDGQRRFAVIGTDPRLAAAGRALARAGFAVGGPEQTALADYILLPLPLDESRTPLAELLRAAKPGALALGGKLSAQARQIAAEAGVDDFLAEATPEAKLSLIREYQAKGHLVAMTGDGSNDAPALAQAGAQTPTSVMLGRTALQSRVAPPVRAQPTLRLARPRPLTLPRLAA